MEMSAEPLIFVGGAAFFSLLYIGTVKYLHSFKTIKLKDADIYTIAMR